MAEPIYITVASGQSVTGAFTLERPDRPLIVEVPSLTANAEVRPQFSTTSGGPFFTLTRNDGTGIPFAVHSGAGPAFGIIEHIPSPWGRFTLTGSQTDTRTFRLLTGAAR